MGPNLLSAQYSAHSVLWMWMGCWCRKLNSAPPSVSRFSRSLCSLPGCPAVNHTHDSQSPSAACATWPQACKLWRWAAFTNYFDYVLRRDRLYHNRKVTFSICLVKLSLSATNNPTLLSVWKPSQTRRALWERRRPPRPIVQSTMQIYYMQICKRNHYICHELDPDTVKK